MNSVLQDANNRRQSIEICRSSTVDRGYRSNTYACRRLLMMYVILLLVTLASVALSAEDEEVLVVSVETECSASLAFPSENFGGTDNHAINENDGESTQPLMRNLFSSSVPPEHPATYGLYNPDAKASTTHLSNSDANDNANTLSSASSSPSSPSSPPLECDLYIAESTIPGAGMGVYTSKELQPGETLSIGDSCVPVIDVRYHNERPFFNPLRDYLWQGDTMTMLNENYMNHDMDAYCYGLGAIPNCHLGAINIHRPRPIYSSTGLHRSNDPGVGAFTPYINATTTATRYVPAGTELFLDYGEEWFTTRDDKFGDDFPFNKHYEAAADLILYFHEQIVETVLSSMPINLSNHSKKNDIFSTYFLEALESPSDYIHTHTLTREHDAEEDEDEIAELIRTIARENSPVPYDRKESISLPSKEFEGNYVLDQIESKYQQIRELAQSLQSPIVNALPTLWFKDPHTGLFGAHLVVETGTIATVLDQVHRRDIHWLQTHGRCIDHIVIATTNDSLSNLSSSQTGHHAIARRDLPRGTVVSTSPLNHIPLDDYLSMNEYEYELNNSNDDENDEEDDDYERFKVATIGQQMVINYCFQHAESSLLLCPYGAGVNYINHPPISYTAMRVQSYDTTVDNRMHTARPNVQIRWAIDFPIAHNDSFLREGYIEELYFNYRTQLAFEYVALRDINQGEPLYLDYGTTWEQAWISHLKKWAPDPDTDNYVSGVDMNLMYENVTIRTDVEQESDPYPLHIEVRCHRDLLYNRKVVTPFDAIPANYDWQADEAGLPCRIVSTYKYVSLNHLYLYDLSVGLHSRNKVDTQSPNRDETSIRWFPRYRVPRSALKFFNKPYTSDIHLSSAFRHPIGIPDDIFPVKWRNKRKGYTPPKRFENLVFDTDVYGD
jgi:hypothetical protein